MESAALQYLNMQKKLKFGGIICAVIAIFVVVVFVANNLADNDVIQSVVADWGYIGVLIVAIIAGLNTFVPLPSATFAPIFLAFLEPNFSCPFCQQLI